jgi:hypothetical protein
MSPSRTKVPLGPFSLATSPGSAVVKTALVAMRFMHLVAQPGARRGVLPVSAVFLVLLLGITLIKAMTRVHMARPGSPGGVPAEAPGVDTYRASRLWSHEVDEQLNNTSSPFNTSCLYAH